MRKQCIAFRGHFREIFTLSLTYIVFATVAFAEENKIIPLYDGIATGSETWKYDEQELKHVPRVVYNVAKPTLTVFNPDKGKGNGTGVVICPGGGFFMLSIDEEGFDVARFLASNGVTCFVLKYRLMESKTDNPLPEFLNRKDRGEAMAATKKLAVVDALTAMRFVRSHARDFHIDPERVGILGFSAGGIIATTIAVKYEPESRPAFVGLIYGTYDPAKEGEKLPIDAPSIFAVAAEDDPFNFAEANKTLKLFWEAGEKPVQLYVYPKGGHGFGIRKQNLPSDIWPDQFVNWLGTLGLLKK